MKNNDLTSEVDGLLAKNPDGWRGESATFTSEELIIENTPVMERWQTPYMNMFASIVTRNGGRILEAGFGMGISAGAIQYFAPTEHVIIEHNEHVFQRLEEFKIRAKNKVTPILGMAEEVVKTLPPESFDGIFYDTYPMRPDKLHTHQFRGA
ncbi:hypothetical protein [Mycobacterium sp.]|uniref:hypothetical protein n=1 Tax=Mycobacterium sp. TaxID=1785 RepID=UPI003BAC45D4